MATRFGELEFDQRRCELSRNGVRVPLSPKAFALLSVLLSERPRAIPKKEILERVWPDVIVEEGNIKNLIAEIRHALEDDPKEPRFIRTVHRLGYAFIAEAWDESSREFATSPRHLVRDDGEIYPIPLGESVIGRDPEARVRINIREASRRHAMITATFSETIVEDLGSKNGTWLNGVRLVDPAVLRDLDELRVGGVTLRFQSEPDATVTVEEDGSDRRS